MPDIGPNLPSAQPGPTHVLAPSGAIVPSGQTNVRPAANRSMDVWSIAILKGIGAPVTQNNLNNLAAWNACEDGVSSQQRNNPMNTTLRGYGGSSINSAGVQHYPGFANGVQALVDTINNTPAFQGIKNVLVNNGSLNQLAAAIGSSGWGSSPTCVAGGNADIGTASGTPATQTSGKSASAADCEKDGNCCALGWTWPSFVGIGGGTVCIWHNSWTRAALGSLIIGSGAIVGITGLVLLTGRAIKLPGPAGALSQALGSKVRSVGKPNMAMDQFRGRVRAGEIKFPGRPPNMKGRDLTSGRFMKGAPG